MRDREPEHEQPLWYKQESFKEFKSAYDQYSTEMNVLFFVGSGLSRSANFPTWRGLLEELADRAQEMGIIVSPKFYEHLMANRFPEAGSVLRQAFDEKEAHPNQWRATLDDIFDDRERTKTIPPVFHTLCQLGWGKIITTNYDRLLELAYEQQAGKELKVVHPFMREYDDSNTYKEQFLFKIHGDIGDMHSDIVLTTEDYQRLYNDERFKTVLGYHLSSVKLILFLGFSHEDPYFHQIFNLFFLAKDRPQKSFALFAAPASGEVAVFEEKLKTLSRLTGVKSITYRNTEERHEEFQLFLDYLHRPGYYDEQYGSSVTRKKATVILLHSGGTIAAKRYPGEHFMEDRLQLPRIRSRFDDRLQTISRLLQQKFRQFYNTATEFQFELKWEILPEHEQILSENATVEHWNNLIRKIEEVTVKYLDGATYVTPEMQLPEGNSEHEVRLRRIYQEELQQYRQVNGPESELFPHQFMEDLKDRYIAGMVILHGTDTLASTASALSVGMRNLPFPVILTGANRPPDEDALYERGDYGGKSDTWKNLVTSLYFLQCFGHRFTELFVAFGDTIHHGMNLRKTTVETTPLKRSNGPTYDIEPFIFRNYSITKQYLFRLIDGVFCNNFYPIGKLSYAALITAKYKGLRHVRQNPFPLDPANNFIKYGFSPAVKHVAVSPSFPHIDVERMLGREPGIRAVLVEGYKSGTYPTIDGSPFADFMYDLYERHVPVILVAHYGITTSQDRYETFPIRDRDIPVLRLYGMIPETALPLLCRVVGCIEQEKWDGAEEADGSRVKSRIDLVRGELKELFKRDDNIISIEFGDVTDQKARADRLTENTRSGGGEGQAPSRELPYADSLWKYALDDDHHHHQHDDHHHHDDDRHHHGLGAHGPEHPGPHHHDAERQLEEDDDIPEDIMVRIPRVDLLWSFSEVIKSYESVGAAPDGFAILSNMGFDWGFKGFRTLQLKRAPRTEGKAFFECNKEKRQELVNRANRLLEQTINSFERSGVAFFVERKNTVITVEGDPAGPSKAAGSPRFSFPITIRRANELLRDDEKYNVQSYSRDEAEFFRRLNHEPTRTEGEWQSSPEEQQRLDAERREDLAVRYKKLMDASWENKTGSLDWFILGVFKGVACAIAWYFLFDRWAEDYDKNKRTGVDKVLQQSVQCDIELGSESFFKFQMTYYGWYEED